MLRGPPDTFKDAGLQCAARMVQCRPPIPVVALDYWMDEVACRQSMTASEYEESTPGFE